MEVIKSNTNAIPKRSCGAAGLMPFIRTQIAGEFDLEVTKTSYKLARKYELPVQVIRDVVRRAGRAV